MGASVVHVGSNGSTLGSSARASTTPAGVPRHVEFGGCFGQEIIYEGWWAGQANPSFDSLRTLSRHGMEWAKVSVTTLGDPALDAPVGQWRSFGWQNRFWSSQQMMAALLQKARDVGMRLQVQFYLSDTAANAGVQARPAAWSQLSDAGLAAQVETYARESAHHFKTRGLEIELFELGNECDFGLCGYSLPTPPQGIVWQENPQWMYDALWSKYVPLYNAAIRGVRSVYPNTAFALHISGFGYSSKNVLAKAFFDLMRDAGVDFQVASLSYPYIHAGMPRVPQPYFAQTEFLSALDHIRLSGKRVHVTEFGYPAAPEGNDAAGAPYPFTADGQAEFLSTYAQALRGRVERVNYWSPDVFSGVNGPGGLPPAVESSGLFASASVARPAVYRISRVAADRCFDWAEKKFPEIFPQAAASATGLGYYYRHYPATGTYVGIREGTDAIVLHNDREWKFAEVGRLSEFLRIAASEGY